MDPTCGHLTIKMSGHPPFGAQVILMTRLRNPPYSAGALLTDAQLCQDRAMTTWNVEYTEERYTYIADMINQRDRSPINHYKHVFRIAAEELHVESGSLVFVTGGVVQQVVAPGTWVSSHRVPDQDL